MNCILALLQAGADTTLKNKVRNLTSERLHFRTKRLLQIGKTPLDLAEKDEIKALLVPADVQLLLSQLSLSEYGPKLVSQLGVLSCSDLAHLDEEDLKSELPDMKIMERRKLLTAVNMSSPEAPAVIESPSSATLSPASSAQGGWNQRTGPWDFFLSHFQLNGGEQMKSLYLELKAEAGKHAWYDKYNNPTKEGMLDGVARSTVFILFLTNEIFTRPFCLLEIREALRLQKPFIMMRQSLDTPSNLKWMGRQSLPAFPFQS